MMADSQLTTVMGRPETVQPLAICLTCTMAVNRRGLDFIHCLYNKGQISIHRDDMHEVINLSKKEAN